jgi:uncharacterized protein YndB with AHSA1/START domain
MPDDAVSGLGFVLAAWMPREADSVLRRADRNDANTFETEGTVTITARGEEALPGDAEAKAFRYDLARADGRSMPIHVDAEGRIVRIDWGGGTVMELRPESTEHLFRPAPPAVEEVETGPEKLVMRGEFPDVEPEAMFALWTTVEGITRWWPPEAEIEAKVGGKFRLSWPGPGWLLVGTVREIKAPQRLAFSWKWAHEPEDAPALEVVVEIAKREEGGSVLTITHGPYEDTPEGRKEREGHRRGWIQFCTRLAEVTKPAR